MFVPDPYLINLVTRSCCLRTTIVKVLLDEFSSDSTIKIGSFFFTFRDSHQQSVDDMLSAIIAHIFPSEDSELSPGLLELCRDKLYYGLSTEFLLSVLTLLLRDTRKTFIVIDALDEISVSGRRLLIETICKMSTMGLQLILTSRREAYLQEGFESLPLEVITIDSAVVDEDIRIFLKDIIPADPRFSKWPESLRDTIQETLVTGAQGM